MPKYGIRIAVKLSNVPNPKGTNGVFGSHPACFRSHLPIRKFKHTVPSVVKVKIMSRSRILAGNVKTEKDEMRTIDPSPSKPRIPTPRYFRIKLG
jgi:hypothetical protein